MRAARIVRPREITIEEVEIPEPAPNQVRFRVVGTGVCASNLGPWLGLPWLSYPLGPGQSGHEAWGVVDAVGGAVTGVREGDRVAAVSYDAYAEYDLADGRAIVRIPDALADQPFPGEAIGAALNVFARSAIQPGQVVAIVGVGFLGSILTRLATNSGAHVIAISRREHALSLARHMGARECVPMREHAQIIERVRDATAGELCDVVIEAVGKQWPLDLAAELTKTRGRLVVAGYHQDGPRQINMQLWNWRGIDVINAHERDLGVTTAGVRAGVDAVLSGEVDPTPLFTHRYPLEELSRALDDTDQRPGDFCKALILP